MASMGKTTASESDSAVCNYALGYADGLVAAHRCRNEPSDRTLWTCGWAQDGRLGVSDEELAAAGGDLVYGKYLAAPKQVGLADIAAIGGGQTHSVAVRGDGTVWAWGFNTYDQLSGGTSTNLPDMVATPVQIDFGQ